MTAPSLPHECSVTILGSLARSWHHPFARRKE